GEKSGRAKSATSIPTPAQPPHIRSRWQQIQAVGAGRWIPQPQRLSIPALGLAPSERRESVRSGASPFWACAERPAALLGGLGLAPAHACEGLRMGFAVL